MEFVGVLLETVLKMLVIGIAAFAGVKLGKNLRSKKDAKTDS